MTSIEQNARALISLRHKAGAGAPPPAPGSGVLPADAVERAVVNRVPERFRELNTEAFRLGRRLAAEARDGAQS